MLEKNKRFEDAEKMFKKAISLSPYFEMALFDLAALYEKQDKLDNAIEVYRNYLENNPARINLRVRIAELLIKEKKYEEAQKELREICCRMP